MIATENGDHVRLLVDLGFTALEAEAYSFLLQESPCTGYRVAQGIAKPVANTYKALEALERKGAVLVDDAENRLCRAVGPAELLGRMQRQFEARCRQAEDALSHLPEAAHDDRLYQLRTRSQVLGRAASMLGDCRQVALCDVVPSLALALKQDLESAAVRGAEIVVKTYAPTDLVGVRVIVRPRGHEIIKALPGDAISLNVDGVQHLLGLLPTEGDAVHQAIWTGSVIFSYLLYNGLVNEFSQAAAMAELERPTTVEALREVFLSLRHLHPVTSRGPAYQNLMTHLGVSRRQQDTASSDDD
jgi:sugar-specific transcriptional regulator TrmB